MHKVLGQKECHSDKNLIDTLDIEEAESEYSDKADYSESEKPDKSEKDSPKKKVLRKFQRAPRYTKENKKEDANVLKELLESNKR